MSLCSTALLLGYLALVVWFFLAMLRLERPARRRADIQAARVIAIPAGHIITRWGECNCGNGEGCICERSSLPTAKVVRR